MRRLARALVILSTISILVSLVMIIFSQDDPTSTNAPPQAQQSWTSIFTNPFGAGGNNGGGNNGYNNDTLDEHIKAILIPRVSGTPGNVQVRQYIVDALKRNNYQVELDEFSASTPIDNVQFANIIASSNPNACRQLVLACHYDSKMKQGFLGATDSAVPCAMLLKISETFNKSFRPSSDTPATNQLGLRFIFFDGEEAFDQWTATDSLYGSRHLAAKWSKQRPPAECNFGRGKTELDRIELFVLLDLIGTKDTTFVSYNDRVKHHYNALQSYERAHMAKNGHNQLSILRNMAFKSRRVLFDAVEDDHVPFKKRGVPILLLLAHPFPSVWHENTDDYDHIDFPKTRRILHVMEEFVANYSKKTD
uniref:glutaminyl-peptide cyclotransferase n=1 Tax=Aceria tosichella TaxID=561515 RepID=A0A6G1SJD8_9ACAR